MISRTLMLRLLCMVAPRHEVEKTNQRMQCPENGSHLQLKTTYVRYLTEAARYRIALVLVLGKFIPTPRSVLLLKPHQSALANSTRSTARRRLARKAYTQNPCEQCLRPAYQTSHRSRR